MLPACGPLGQHTCDRSPESNPVIVYRGGEVAGGIYMSSPWSGPLLFFPGGARYGLEHKLGATPRSIEAFLAFDEGGVGAGKLAQAAGNQVLFEAVDAERITVANDSCSDYYLLVVASATH